jgi:small-conductance mechanosensitive channel
MLCSSARRVGVSVVAVALLWLAAPAGAQMMPGAPAEPKKAEQNAEKAGEKADAPETPEGQKAALERQIREEHATGLRKFYLTYLSEHSPYQSLILAVLTLIILTALKKYTTRLLRKYAHPRLQKKENLDRFLRTWNAVWKFIIGVLVLIALSGSLRLLGLSAAFLGMMLGWSLQAPVTGLAAWLMILLKRPFRIGDRVIIGGIIGDVTDITLTHVILNQVGGTIGGEERSGRGVLIPNATLFGQIIMNYTLESKYMLDEVPIRLTFDSDYDLAREIMLDAAKAVTADIVAKTKKEPFTRCEFFEAGVIVRLRYQTVPARRQEISSDIVEKILHGFKEHYPRVKYCYPQSVVHYRWAEEDTADDASRPAQQPNG